MDTLKLYSIYQESTRISIDSRNIQSGDLFFAITGDRFDGNTFAQKAIEGGARFAIIDNPKYQLDDQYILVDNSLKTLQDLATFHRQQLTIPIIAITGSNGKTTTKELIYQVLSQKYKTFATPRNFNNHIGLPLSILQITNKHEIAVIEMGANNPGEISFLCQIAQPSYGLITNIGKEHLEGFKDLEGVKKTNGELYEYLKEKKGLIFINSDHDELKELINAYKNAISYGTRSSAIHQIKEKSSDSYFLSIEYVSEAVNIQTKLIGNYNTENIATAICIGKYFEVDNSDIKKGIERYIPTNNRSQLLEKDGNTFLLDAYNANPSSMEAALKSFAKTSSTNKKMVILGDMLEMGEESIKEHTHIVELLKELQFDSVITVGDEFAKVPMPSEFEHFDTVISLKEWFISQQFKNYAILIKGSRGIALEKILD